jgi:hypothetical protein
MGMNMKATTAVAVAFASVLNALAPTAANAEAIHPILDTSTSAPGYSGRLWNIVGDSGVPLGQGLGRGGTQTLEANLKLPSDQVRYAFFPSKERLGIGSDFAQFAVPPQALYATADIPFCVGKAATNTVYVKGHITTAGEVIKDTSPTPASSGQNPCAAWMQIQSGKWSNFAATQIPIKARVLTGEKVGAVKGGPG